MQLPLPAEPQTDATPGMDRKTAGPTSARGARINEPDGAAALTADLVRRGRNPWWGKDQPPPREPSRAGAPAPEGTAFDDPEPGHCGDMDEDTETPARRAPFRRVETRDEDPPPKFRFSLLDRELWRDIALFMAVFSAASAAMLYFSLRSV